MANATRMSTVDEANRIAVDQRALQGLLSCGYQTALLIARNAGAEITIGKRKIYNVNKIKKYLDSINELGE